MAKVVAGLDGEHGLTRDRHPTWHPPTQRDANGIQVMNSLTENVEAFAPRNGRLVKWYTCGPTVYDVAHMGHARNYLTFDIIRRIMEDYFGYSVIFQMNVTDIDDKIIKRARINKLLGDFKTNTLHGGDVAALITFTESAVSASEKKLAARAVKLAEPIPAGANSRAKAEREEKLMELQLKQEQLLQTKEKIVAATATANFECIFAAASSVNGDLLDEQLGGQVIDQQIFEDHARYYERTFFDDMQRLGIRDPDIVTRVTEYVPQVVEFIARIIQNGFAYEAESSIYFDTEAYLKAGHAYPKLKPGGDRNATEDEMLEGEGALAATVEGEKRSPNDFALWKYSKPGEPRWPSPWGAGRPGWHIECSVMASDILGENMDVHSGGWDLKFPHHDNECAQSEAFHGHHQWVNYFMHCGHLHIKGLKMSKSLKNFITIREALDDLGASPRTIRLLFLANAWNKPMNFSDQSLDEAKERERVLRAFFGSIDIVLRGDGWKAVQGANTMDRDLLAKYVEVEQSVHEALQNNFDTPTALQQLMALVAATNQYLLSKERPSATLLRKVSLYITRIFRIFGVVEGNDEIGLNKSGGAGAGAKEEEQRFFTAVDALVRFRDEVRETAKTENVAKAFLPLCDQVRDAWLVDAGVRLEDAPSGPTTWKRDDPNILRKEVEERRTQVEGERRKKLANQIETKRKLVEKWEQYTTPTHAYLAQQEEARPAADKRFAHFDPTTGLPTKTMGGEDVGEKEVKKISKELAKYAKTREEFEQKGGDAWLAEQQAELKAMREELAGH